MLSACHNISPIKAGLVSSVITRLIAGFPPPIRRVFHGPRPTMRRFGLCRHLTPPVAVQVFTETRSGVCYRHFSRCDLRRCGYLTAKGVRELPTRPREETRVSPYKVRRKIYSLSQRSNYTSASDRLPGLHLTVQELITQFFFTTLAVLAETVGVYKYRMLGAPAHSSDVYVVAVLRFSPECCPCSNPNLGAPINQPGADFSCADTPRVRCGGQGQRYGSRL